MIKYKLIDMGLKADIYSILDNNDRDVFTKFLQKLNKGYQPYIIQLIEKIKKRGLLLNKKRYELMGGTTDIYELKVHVGGGYRILALRIEQLLKYDYIIIKCFKKPKKKQQNQYIKQADEIGSKIRAGYAVFKNDQ